MLTVNRLLARNVEYVSDRDSTIAGSMNTHS